MSFSEKAIGTNAVALAIKLKKSIYTIPQHHYNDLLKDLFLYAVPLFFKGEVLGFFVLCSLNEKIGIDLKILTDLAAYRLINEFKTQTLNSLLSHEKTYCLTKKQIEILKLMATGLPDKIIASNQGISINTVKYHKKFIFKKLDVQCTAQAVIKCVKLNLLSIDEIDC